MIPTWDAGVEWSEVVEADREDHLQQHGGPAVGICGIYFIKFRGMRNFAINLFFQKWPLFWKSTTFVMKIRKIHCGIFCNISAVTLNNAEFCKYPKPVDRSTIGGKRRRKPLSEDRALMPRQQLGQLNGPGEGRAGDAGGGQAGDSQTWMYCYNAGKSLNKPESKTGNLSLGIFC